MFKALMGGGRASDSRSTSSKSSSRRRTDSKASSTVSRKSSRGDDRDRGLGDLSAYPSSSRSKRYASSAAGDSVASSYATADPGFPTDPDRTRSERSSKRRGRDDDPELDRTDRYRDRDSDGKSTRSRRERVRSPSRERERARSSRDDRSGDIDDDRDSTGRRERQRTHFAADAMAAPDHQFPGMMGAATMADPPSPHVAFDPHVQQQFPGQFPGYEAEQFSPNPAGEAADYYGDQGQSVQDQPGVRPKPPLVIPNSQAHLMTASPTENPPPEPSSVGEIGAAASYYDAEPGMQAPTQPATLPSSSKPPKPTIHTPGMAGAAALGAAGFAAAGGSSTSDDSDSPHLPVGASPSNYHPTATGRPPKPSHSHGVGTAVGAAAAGAAAGYMLSGHHHHSSSHADSVSQYPMQNPDDVSLNGVGYPGPSMYHDQANPPPYATMGAAAAAGYAMNPSHPHHAAVYHGSPFQSGGMAFQQPQRGPLSKFVDFWRDPEGVGMFEDYTETIGVCRYCFEPGTTSRDAPRKHNYKARRRSSDRISNGSRIDKLTRYTSSEDESRRRRKSKGSSWLPAALTGYAVKSMFNNKDFSDTYSVRSGRVASSSHDSESVSTSRRSQTSRGVYRRSSRSRSRERHAYRPQSDGKIHMHRYDEHRPRSRSRSRSPSSSKHHVLRDAALGAAVGTAAMSIAKSRDRSSSPSALKGRGRKSSSSDSSILDISSKPSRKSVATGFGSFFTASSENRKKRRAKRRKSIFSFNNSSSSSLDNDLAFGSGYSRKSPGKSKKKGKKQDHGDVDAALLGLGAAATALASSSDRRGRRRGEILAGKDSRSGHSDYASSAANDEDWEDLDSGDQSASSVSSGLAFGGSGMFPRDDSSNSSDSSQSLWGWRWGSKKSKKDKKKRKERLAAGAAIAAGTAGVAALASGRHRDSRTTSQDAISSTGSLQQMAPVPTSDPSRFDAVKLSSLPSEPAYVRPGPIPLQQPQPVAPVCQSVFTTQGESIHAYTAPAGPPVFDNSFVPYGYGQQSRDGPWTSTGYPEGPSAAVLPHRRSDSSPVFHTEPLEGVTASSLKRHTLKEQPSVSFDLTHEQQEKERRADRREQSKRDAGRYDGVQLIDRESEMARRDADRASRRSEDREERRRRDRDYDDNYARDRENRGKDSSSWVGAAAAGAVGAAAAATVLSRTSNADTSEASQRRNDERREKRRAQRRQTEPESSISSYPVTEDIEKPSYAKRDVSASPSRRSTYPEPARTYHNYADFFAPEGLRHSPDSHSQHEPTSMPAIVEAVPASERSRAVDTQFTDEPYQNYSNLPWPVPTLKLIEPTPPQSMSGSVRDVASPIPSTPEVIPEDKKAERSTTGSRVSWGEHELHEYEVPSSEHDSVDHDAMTREPESPKDVSYVSHVEEISRSADTPSPKSMPRDYGNDIEFAATIAATAAAAGFDPSVVTDNPMYHTRSSPPGSENIDAGWTDVMPHREGHGFVEGEVDTPQERFIKNHPFYDEPEEIRERYEESEPQHHPSIAQEVIASLSQKNEPESSTRDAPRSTGDDMYSMPGGFEQDSPREMSKEDFRSVVSAPMPGEFEDHPRRQARDFDLREDVTSPAVEEVDAPTEGKKKRRKRRSKRDSGDILEDSASVTSSPARMGEGAEKGKSIDDKNKEKKSGGFLSGIFGSRVSEPVESKRSSDEGKSTREVQSEIGPRSSRSDESLRRRRKERSSSRHSHSSSRGDAIEDDWAPEDSSVADKENINVESYKSSRQRREERRRQRQEGILDSDSARKKDDEKDREISQDHDDHQSFLVRSPDWPQDGTVDGRDERGVLGSTFQPEAFQLGQPPIVSSHSRPTSPSADLTRALPDEDNNDGQRSRRSSVLRSTESPTAVPIHFRRPPTSPNTPAAVVSPVSPSTGSPTQTRRSRPNSTEFKHSREIRPLWLVERHGVSKAESLPDDEALPSLPSSKSSSTEDLTALPDETSWEKLDLSHQVHDSSRGMDFSSPQRYAGYYEAEQTPTAATFGLHHPLHHSPHHPHHESRKDQLRYEFHSPSELLQDPTTFVELPPSPTLAALPSVEGSAVGVRDEDQSRELDLQNLPPLPSSRPSTPEGKMMSTDEAVDETTPTQERITPTMKRSGSPTAETSRDLSGLGAVAAASAGLMGLTHSGDEGESTRELSFDNETAPALPELSVLETRPQEEQDKEQENPVPDSPASAVFVDAASAIAESGDETGMMTPVAGQQTNVVDLGEKVGDELRDLSTAEESSRAVDMDVSPVETEDTKTVVEETPAQTEETIEETSAETSSSKKKKKKDKKKKTKAAQEAAETEAENVPVAAEVDSSVPVEEEKKGVTPAEYEPIVEPQPVVEPQQLPEVEKAQQEQQSEAATETPQPTTEDTAAEAVEATRSLDAEAEAEPAEETASSSKKSKRDKKKKKKAAATAAAALPGGEESTPAESTPPDETTQLGEKIDHIPVVETPVPETPTEEQVSETPISTDGFVTPTEERMYSPVEEFKEARDVPFSSQEDITETADIHDDTETIVPEKGLEEEQQIPEIEAPEGSAEPVSPESQTAEVETQEQEQASAIQDTSRSLDISAEQEPSQDIPPTSTELPAGEPCTEVPTTEQAPESEPQSQEPETAAPEETDTTLTRKESKKKKKKNKKKAAAEGVVEEPPVSTEDVPPAEDVPAVAEGTSEPTQPEVVSDENREVPPVEEPVQVEEPVSTETVAESITEVAEPESTKEAPDFTTEEPPSTEPITEEPVSTEPIVEEPASTEATSEPPVEEGTKKKKKKKNRKSTLTSVPEVDASQPDPLPESEAAPASEPTPEPTPAPVTEETQPPHDGTSGEIPVANDSPEDQVPVSTDIPHTEEADQAKEKESETVETTAPLTTGDVEQQEPVELDQANDGGPHVLSGSGSGSEQQEQQQQEQRLEPQDAAEPVPEEVGDNAPATGKKNKKKKKKQQQQQQQQEELASAEADENVNMAVAVDPSVSGAAGDVDPVAVKEPVAEPETEVPAEVPTEGSAEVQTDIEKPNLEEQAGLKPDTTTAEDVSPAAANEEPLSEPQPENDRSLPVDEPEKSKPATREDAPVIETKEPEQNQQQDQEQEQTLEQTTDVVEEAPAEPAVPMTAAQKKKAKKDKKKKEKQAALLEETPTEAVPAEATPAEGDGDTTESASIQESAEVTESATPADEAVTAEHKPEEPVPVTEESDRAVSADVPDPAPVEGDADKPLEDAVPTTEAEAVSDIPKDDAKEESAEPAAEELAREDTETPRDISDDTFVEAVQEQSQEETIPLVDTQEQKMEEATPAPEAAAETEPAAAEDDPLAGLSAKERRKAKKKEKKRQSLPVEEEQPQPVNDDSAETPAETPAEPVESYVPEPTADVVVKVEEHAVEPVSEDAPAEPEQLEEKSEPTIEPTSEDVHATPEQPEERPEESSVEAPAVVTAETEQPAEDAPEEFQTTTSKKKAKKDKKKRRSLALEKAAQEDTSASPSDTPAEPVDAPESKEEPALVETEAQSETADKPEEVPIETVSQDQETAPVPEPETEQPAEPSDAPVEAPAQEQETPVELEEPTEPVEEPQTPASKKKAKKDKKKRKSLSLGEEQPPKEDTIEQSADAPAEAAEPTEPEELKEEATSIEPAQITEEITAEPVSEDAPVEAAEQPVETPEEPQTAASKKKAKKDKKKRKSVSFATEEPPSEANESSEPAVEEHGLAQEIEEPKTDSASAEESKDVPTPVEEPESTEPTAVSPEQEPKDDAAESTPEGVAEEPQSTEAVEQSASAEESPKEVTEEETSKDKGLGQELSLDASPETTDKIDAEPAPGTPTEQTVAEPETPETPVDTEPETSSSKKKNKKKKKKQKTLEAAEEPAPTTEEEVQPVVESEKTVDVMIPEATETVSDVKEPEEPVQEVEKPEDTLQPVEVSEEPPKEPEAEEAQPQPSPPQEEQPTPATESESTEDALAGMSAKERRKAKKKEKKRQSKSLAPDETPADEEPKPDTDADAAATAAPDNEQPSLETAIAPAEDHGKDNQSHDGTELHADNDRDVTWTDEMVSSQVEQQQTTLLESPLPPAPELEPAVAADGEGERAADEMVAAGFGEGEGDGEGIKSTVVEVEGAKDEGVGDVVSEVEKSVGAEEQAPAVEDVSSVVVGESPAGEPAVVEEPIAQVEIPEEPAEATEEVIEKEAEPVSARVSKKLSKKERKKLQQREAQAALLAAETAEDTTQPPVEVEVPEETHEKSLLPEEETTKAEDVELLASAGVEDSAAVEGQKEEIPAALPEKPRQDAADPVVEPVAPVEEPKEIGTETPGFESGPVEEAPREVEAEELWPVATKKKGKKNKKKKGLAVEEPVEEPKELAAEQPEEEPTEQTVETAVEEPVGQPVEQPAEGEKPQFASEPTSETVIAEEKGPQEVEPAQEPAPETNPEPSSEEKDIPEETQPQQTTESPEEQPEAADPVVEQTPALSHKESKKQKKNAKKQAKEQEYQEPVVADAPVPAEKPVELESEHAKDSTALPLEEPKEIMPEEKQQPGDSLDKPTEESEPTVSLDPFDVPQEEATRDIPVTTEVEQETAAAGAEEEVQKEEDTEAKMQARALEKEDDLGLAGDLIEGSPAQQEDVAPISRKLSKKEKRKAKQQAKLGFLEPAPEPTPEPARETEPESVPEPEQEQEPESVQERGREPEQEPEMKPEPVVVEEQLPAEPLPEPETVSTPAEQSMTEDHLLTRKLSKKEKKKNKKRQEKSMDAPQAEPTGEQTTADSSAARDDDAWPTIDWEKDNINITEKSPHSSPEAHHVAPFVPAITEFDESAIPEGVTRSMETTIPLAAAVPEPAMSDVNIAVPEKRLMDEMEVLPHKQSKVANVFPHLERGLFKKPISTESLRSVKDGAEDETRDRTIEVSEAPVSTANVPDQQPVTTTERSVEEVMKGPEVEATHESTRSMDIEAPTPLYAPTPIHEHTSTLISSTPAEEQQAPRQMSPDSCELRRSPSIHGRHDHPPRSWSLEQDEERKKSQAKTPPPPSLFGGASPQAVEVSPPRTPLHTIAEEDRVQKSGTRSRTMGEDSGTPRLEMKPEHVLPRPQTPVRKFTDNALSRQAWPTGEDDEEMRRVKKRGSRRAIEAEGMAILRPSSVASVGSRTSSGGARSLRRTNRSTSGDLRAAAAEQEETEAAAGEAGSGSGSGGEGERRLGASPPLPSDLSVERIASSSSYDPVTDKGKRPLRTMTDVYEGWGETPSSPRSPSRPPSVRHRRSMQHLQDLESRLDQLISENRLLIAARDSAEGKLRNASVARRKSDHALNTRDADLRDRESEVEQLKNSVDWLQKEVNRLTEENEGLTTTNTSLTAAHVAELSTVRDSASRELEALRYENQQLSTDLHEKIREQIDTALAQKNTELRRLREELESARDKVKELQQQIAASMHDNVIVFRDEDYFDAACQKLCGHVQQWVLRFSKHSDHHRCRKLIDLQDEKVADRFDNAILDGSDADIYLADRVRRRDVFMSVVMTMVWEFIFTRYLFGMDREQRQKLKSLEKHLTEVGPKPAIHRWRATTLTLLAKRPSFARQRETDTEAVALEIFDTLTRILPPPKQAETPLLDSLRKVLRVAVNLSIEMRTQLAEYIMLPPLQPEYDTNGDLARQVAFNASLMNERSGATTSNEALEAQQAVVRIVLFPLVVKKGNDSGEGDDEVVVCPAQVLIARPDKDPRMSRMFSSDRMSLDATKSVHSIAPSSTMDMSNVI